MRSGRGSSPPTPRPGSARATPSTRVRYLTADQIHRTADAAETLVSPHGRRIGSRRDRTMILLLAYTGLRDGELAALRVGDVRYRSRRIHITRTVTLLRDGRLGEGTPKNGRSRRVPIPGFLPRDLRELTDGRPAGAYLFANAKGGRIHIGSWVRRIWHPALAAAGIRGDAAGARHRACAPSLVRVHGDRGGRRPEDAAGHPRPFQRADHARPVRGSVARPDGPGQRSDRGDVRPTLPGHVPKMSPKRSRRWGRPFGNGLIPPFSRGVVLPSCVMYQPAFLRNNTQSQAGVSVTAHGYACCAEHRPEHRRTTAKQPSAHPIPASTHNGTPPQTPGTGRPPPTPAASPRNTGTFGGHRRRPRHATPPGARGPPENVCNTVRDRPGTTPDARHRRRTSR